MSVVIIGLIKAIKESFTSKLNRQVRTVTLGAENCLYLLRCECSLSLIGIWAIIHLSCGQFRRMVSHVLGALGTGNLCLL